jgi:hypothetical protein
VSALAQIPITELEQMTAELAQYTCDPFGAVMYGFPWNEPGTDLEGVLGPRKWQRDVLQAIAAHLKNSDTRHRICRIVVSSGHGPGKGALAAMLTWWGLSTFEDCRINITANTKGQLDTKTQPELEKWFRMAVNRHWFKVMATSIKSEDPERDQTWRADLVPWSDFNAQASAGLHNARKRIILICDEASEISDTVFEVFEGALTDGNTQMLLILLGNPTRSVGRFYDAAFGKLRHLYKKWVIDSRDVEGTAKEEIQEAVDLYGEDSDFVRVRYRGLPPRAGSGQFIDFERITEAQKRAPRTLPTDALVAGVDFAWGGEDNNVVRFRRGFDARSIPPIKIKGEFTRDPAVMTNRLAEVLTKTYTVDGLNMKLSMLFFDSAGIAAPVEARLRALGHQNMMVVNFGAESPDPACAYFRDCMWERMKQWLIQGAIDKDPELEADLGAPILVSDPKQRIKLESKELMKKRLAKLGKDPKSPDDGDALALTFAHTVLPAKEPEPAAEPEARNDDLGWLG